MRSLLAVLLTLLAPLAAHAELYGAIGWARVTSDRPAFNRADLVNLGETPTGNSSNADAIPLALGYRFVKWFAIEASYLDAKELQRANYSARAAADQLSRGTYTREWGYRAIGLSAVGSLFFTERWAAVLKGSANHVTAEYRSRALVTRTDLVPSQTPVNDSTSHKSTEWIPSVALGVAYVGKPIGARLMFERFADKSGLYGQGNDLNGVKSIALQATFSF